MENAPLVRTDSSLTVEKINIMASKNSPAFRNPSRFSLRMQRVGVDIDVGARDLAVAQEATAAGGRPCARCTVNANSSAAIFAQAEGKRKPKINPKKAAKKLQVVGFDPLTSRWWSSFLPRVLSWRAGERRGARRPYVGSDRTRISSDTHAPMASAAEASRKEKKRSRCMVPRTRATTAKGGAHTCRARA